MMDQFVAIVENHDAKSRKQALVELGKTLGQSMEDGGISAINKMLYQAMEGGSKSAVVPILEAQKETRSQLFSETFVRGHFSVQVMRIGSEPRGLASQNVIELGLNARRFQARNGRLPKSLDELAELVDPSVMIEPQTGEPMGFRALENEIVIYHSGFNTIDDGGDIDGNSAKDWGIRIKE
jgi:hypothetical protein